jgi:hypothetical protein
MGASFFTTTVDYKDPLPAVVGLSCGGGYKVAMQRLVKG